LFSARSFCGGETGPNPTDRAKLGSKRHLICDGRGVPLAIQLTGANRNDSQQALSLVDEKLVPDFREVTYAVCLKRTPLRIGGAGACTIK